MLLFPNPYCAPCDRHGRLAGACPEPEEMRPGTLPMRVYIGARRVHDEESYVAGDEGAGIDSRSDRWFEFDVKPSKVHVAVSLGTSYREIVRGKDAFLVQKEDEVPIEELAHARARLMREIRIDHGMTPNTSTWAKQFPLDVEVAAHATYKALEKQIDEDVAKAKKALEERDRKVAAKAEERAKAKANATEAKKPAKKET